MKQRLLALLLAVPLVLVAAWAATEEERIPLLGFDWEQVNEVGPFGERFIHRGVVMGDRMYISGGLNADDKLLGDVWSSSDGAEWRREIETAPWSARFGHGMAALDSTLYVMGGYDGVLRNDVWKSADGAHWELVTDAAPWAPRSHFQVVTHDGALFLMGGRGQPERYGDVWKSTDGSNWELLTTTAWPPRSHFGAVSHKGRLVILAGADFDFPKDEYLYHRDTWSSADGRDWTLLNDNGPWRRRVLMEMVSVGDYIYAIGGDDKPWYPYMRRDAWISPDGADWMKLRRTGNYGVHKRLQFDLRINHVLLAKDDTLYIIGGHQYWFGSFSSVDRFGKWRVDNVWKSNGTAPPEFIPEYGPEDDEDESSSDNS